MLFREVGLVLFREAGSMLFREAGSSSQGTRGCLGPDCAYSPSPGECRYNYLNILENKYDILH